MADMATARDLMVKSQLLTCDSQDEAILSAVSDVRREDFVPTEFFGSAYVDDDIPLGKTRYLMPVLAFTQILEAAEIAPEHNVLVIGCGLGYSAAVVSHLAGKVTACENRPELVGKARKNLAPFKNVEVITAPLAAGYEAHQPYDRIIIEGSVQQVPSIILEQLAEGGRVVAVQNLTLRPGTLTGNGRVLTILRQAGDFVESLGEDCSVYLLADFEKKTGFSF